MLMLEATLQIARNGNPPLIRQRLAKPAEPVQGTAGDILIIEDHAMVLDVLQTSLRRLCPNVEQVCVRSAQAALDVLSRQWMWVFVDPDAAGVDEGSLIHELARCGLTQRCCLITTRSGQSLKRYLQGIELPCVSTRMPIDEFDAALERAALGIATPRSTSVKGPSSDKRVPRFTPRHVELLRLVQLGLQNKSIARELGISEGTVRNHLHLLMKRLGVRNRMQAVQEAARFGLLDGFGPSGSTMPLPAVG